MELRPDEAADFETHIWVCNHADPARPTTKAQVTHSDASLEPDAIRARFLIFEAGQLIGALNLEPPHSNPLPNELRLQLLLLYGFADRAAVLCETAEHLAVSYWRSARANQCPAGRTAARGLRVARFP